MVVIGDIERAAPGSNGSERPHPERHGLAVGRCRSSVTLDLMSARRCSRLNGKTLASTKSPSSTKSAGNGRLLGVLKRKTSLILPAETNSWISASPKVLRRVSASTTASSVAGAFASMNSHMEFTDSHLHDFNYTPVRARASHQAASHRSPECLPSAFCRPGRGAERAKVRGVLAVTCKALSLFQDRFVAPSGRRRPCHSGPRRIDLLGILQLSTSIFSVT